jgi:hypothetical protein
MKNTITFDGSRTYVSSNGNVERYDFIVTSTYKITESAAKSIGNIHGMGGQDFSCEEEKITNCFGDLYVYKCKAKCYCD